MTFEELQAEYAQPTISDKTCKYYTLILLFCILSQKLQRSLQENKTGKRRD